MQINPRSQATNKSLGSDGLKNRLNQVEQVKQSNVDIQKCSKERDSIAPFCPERDDAISLLPNNARFLEA